MALWWAPIFGKAFSEIDTLALATFLYEVLDVCSWSLQLRSPRRDEFLDD